jgi:hypothetical protein
MNALLFVALGALRAAGIFKQFGVFHYKTNHALKVGRISPGAGQLGCHAARLRFGAFSASRTRITIYELYYEC